MRSAIGVWACAVVLVAAVATAQPAEGTRVAAVTATLAEDTRFATDFHVIDSGLPGPTVLIVAGIHGNERAPPRAARQLLGWQPARGTLVVVPEANRLALAVRGRHTPRTRWLDLNRCFPTADRSEPEGQLARALWRLALDVDPDFVLDLHEGYGFHRRDPKTMGSSVVYVTGEQTRGQAERVRVAVNATIDRPSNHFTLITPGPRASFARSVTERLGIPTLVLETTWPTQPMELRIHQQLLMVRTVLRDLGVLDA